MSLSRMKIWNISSLRPLAGANINCQSVRCTASTATAANQDASAVEWDNALPYKDIPKIGFWNLMKRMDEQRKDKKPRYHKLFADLFKEFNYPIMRLSVPFVGDQVVVARPEDVQTLLVNDGKHPVEPGFDFIVMYRNHRKDLFTQSTGLLGSHGEEWYKVRSMVQQDMMRPKSALFYLDDITMVTREFLDLLDKNLDAQGSVPDVIPLIYRWALESVGAIFLDSRIGCLNEPPAKEVDEMVKCVEVCLGDEMMELAGRPPIWKIYKTKTFRRFDAAAEQLFRVTEGMIKEAQKKNKDKVYSSRDEMSVLAKLTQKCGPDSTIPQVMAMDALFAGIDTTGNTSGFLCYLLGANPDKQELMYKEIMEKLPDPTQTITPAIYNELKYTKAVLQETLRMLPVVGGLGRLTTKDMVLSGHQVPSGTRVSFTSPLVMSSEEYFTEPDKFLPERWLRGCPQSKKHHPYAYIPFAHGPRMCIGRRFAELEVHVLAAELIRRYKLVYHGPPVDIITPFVNRPDKPIAMQFIRRN
eukprot:TRINITY_DN28986_c0_g1_i6.p1 TRINITY_DN28986_c0_g1~~TRINITY_DN28986_c0_g1_i6.p1  ORF type:complete len:535 (-),score=114.95 TRINITY_DN28986_c0_g1_i6:246-1823(-)